MDPELRNRLADFVQYRQQHLTGDEKGEAQIFCDRLFQALGHEGLRQAGATLEMRIQRRDQRGTAFADLMWKPRCMLEMKKAGTDLSKAYRQAFDYWVLAVPDRPQYVILCNFDEFWIYDFDQQLDAPMERLKLADLPLQWEALAFMLPTVEAPIFTNNLVKVTREAAAQMARIFRELQGRGIEREKAQRFVLQSVVAMFAEDIGLLPGQFLSRALHDATTGSEAYDLVFGLFREMNTPGVTGGGRYQGTPYFNGGIFAAVEPFDLTADEMQELRWAAATDWSAVRPEIFGTIFEQSMDKGERHAQGAHFTSQADIARVVVPTIVQPWRERIAAATTIRQVELVLGAMYDFRVLDPACGSGNFLYVAYREMRRLENEALNKIAQRRQSPGLRLQRGFRYLDSSHFMGIDRNPFAVEVAKVTMMLAKKLAADELLDNDEVLPLDNLDGSIVAADALFSPWPAADAIIGNPPYVGRRDMVRELGAAYTARLAAEHANVDGVSDFVCYWFPIAHEHLPDGGRAGFVATNSIRDTDSRRVSLDHIVDHGGVITEAVSSKPWSGDAQVTVSIVNWVKNQPVDKAVLWLNNTDLRLELDTIPTTLRPMFDVRHAKDLTCNKKPKRCFQGQTTGAVAAFVIDEDTRRDIIRRDPKSAAYIHPAVGGDEILDELETTKYVIDLPFRDAVQARNEAAGALAHLRERVYETRAAAAAREEEQNRERLLADPHARRLNRHHTNFLATWWRHAYRREELLQAIAQLPRYLATSRVASEQRMTVFVYLTPDIRPDDSTTVFALDDDYSFGILSSALHRAWLEARCSTLRRDLRYTSTTVFDTYPWPQTPTAAQVSKIEECTREVLAARAAYPDMCLSAQYNTLRTPGTSRLRSAHEALDSAVLAAYGFSAEDDPLAQLLALNLDIDAAGSAKARGPGRPLTVV